MFSYIILYLLRTYPHTIISTRDTSQYISTKQFCQNEIPFDKIVWYL